MEKIILTDPVYSSDHLPFVVLDKETSVFKIYGYMLDDDRIDEHLFEVKQWLQNYKNEANSHSNFHLGFYYISEYGLNFVAELITMISKIANSKIYWEYDSDDEDMEEIIIEISNSTGVEILSRKVGVEIISGKVSIPNSIFDSPYFVPNT